MKNLISFIAIAIALFIVPYTAGAQLAAEIPHSYDVSASGSFQYTIPIRIPPGIKNMVPQLAINYNSQGGDGNLGVGWSVSGLSAITRGPSNIYKDGYPKSVNFSGDALFLDGQKLYSNGAGQLLTEIKNFALIEYRNNGTLDYYAVEYPNGITYEYGSTVNSQMKAQGRTDVLTWAVSKIFDAYGNYIEFTYNNSQTTGEYSAATITYGLNSNTTDDIPVTISFNYTSRPDINTAWIAGSEVRSNQLLDNITITFDNNSQANKYQFTYDDVLHSRLTTIEELRDGVSTLDPITIQWGPYADNEDLVPTNINSGNRRVQAGDFNGDGFSDLVGYQSLGGNTNMEVYINDHKNGNGKFIQKSSVSLNFAQVINSPTRLVFDYDGDGLDDIIVSASGTASSGDPYVALWLIRANGSTGSSVFDTPVQIHYSENSNNQNTNFAAFTHYLPGDFDGDGKGDIIAFHPYNFDGVNVVEDYEVFVIAHQYGSHQIEHIDDGHIMSVLALDNNGDGKDEFLFTTDATIPVSFSGRLKVYYVGVTPVLDQSPTTWPVEWLGFANYPSEEHLMWPADFNGDGKTDLLTMTQNWTPNFWQMAYADGIEAAPYIFSGPVTPPSPLSLLGTPTLSVYNAGWYNYFPGDFNGDGLIDFLQVIKGVDKISSHYYMYYSTGMGFELTDAAIDIDADWRHSCLGDFNGDGQVDLMCARTLDSFEYVTFHKFNKAWKIESITHANKTVNVEYETIPNDAGYVKMATGHSDYLNRTIPINVAKRVYDDGTVDNNYTYEGFMYHKYGLGMRGFQKFTTENTLGQKVYNKYNLTTRIPFLEETQVYDAFGSLPYAKLIKYAQIDTNGGASGKCRIIIPYADTVIDYVTAQKTYTAIIPDSSDNRANFFKYGSLLSTEITTTDLADVHNSTVKTTYMYDDWDANKGKPDSIITYSDIDPLAANSFTNSVRYSYAAAGDLATVTTDGFSDNQKVTGYSYDLYGNVIQTSITAHNIGGTTDVLYTYTPCGKFMESEEKELGYKTTYDYGNLHASWGNVMIKTDVKGFDTEYEYDAVNRLVKTTDVSMSIDNLTSYQWGTGTGGSFLKTENTNTANQAKSLSVYDRYHRITAKESPTQNTYHANHYSYGPTGLMYSSDMPDDGPGPSINPMETIYTYDDYDRQTDATDNNGVQTITTYTISGGKLHTTVTNGSTGASKTTVTCGSTLWQVYGSGGDDIKYTYFGNGTVATTTVNNSNSFTNTIDAYGRTVTSTQPDAGTVEFEYNALDQVVKESRATGTEYVFTYDDLGRVLTKQEVGQPNPYTFQYYDVQQQPSTGELYEKTHPDGYYTRYMYDANGQLQELKEMGALPGSVPFSTYYTYYADGNLRYITYPSDMRVEYTYDARGFVHEAYLDAHPAMNYPDHKLWMGVTDEYDYYRRMRRGFYYDQNGNSLYEMWNEFDEYGYRTEQKLFLPWQPGTPLAQHQYVFDKHTGNLLSRTDGVRGITENFSYDNHFDRLTAAGNTLTMTSIPMAYDIEGNILNKGDIPVHPTPAEWKYAPHTYAVDRIARPTGPPLAPTPIPLVRQAITWNSAGMVQNIIENTKNKIDFTYGPDEERIKAEYTDMSTGGAGTHVYSKYYAHNYERIVLPNGDKQEYYYIWAEGNLISIVNVNTTVIGGVVTTNLYYPFTDHLGSITHLFDPIGTGGPGGNGLLEERSYDAWGQPRDPNTWQNYTIGNPMPAKWITDRGYTGHEHIWCEINNGGSPVVYDNHIINMNGRLYDPQVARMFSPDKYISDGANSQDYNKYSYVRNNPLKYTDPTGNYVGADDLAAAIIGGVFNLGYNIFNGNLSGYGFGETIARGASAFAGGAIAGVGALYPEFGGWIWGGAAVGAINASLSGASAVGVVQGAAMGSLTMAAGGYAGAAIASGMSPLMQNIASPMLRGMIVGSVSGAAVGYGTGFAGGYVTTGDWGAAYKAGLDGMWWGAGSGAFAGAVGGYLYAKRNDINPITGERNQQTVTPMQPLQPQELPTEVKDNFNRFIKKAPANSKPTITIELMDDGNYMMKATSPAKNIPGSKAVYQKIVNPEGITIDMIKTTYGPDGTIIHIKPK